MGRVFFPTVSLNRFGVRDTDQQATLAGAIARFPAEPTPRAAMTPTGPLLGAFPARYLNSDGWYPRAPIRPVVFAPPAPPSAPVSAPQVIPPAPAPVISSSGGGGAVVAPPPPPSAPVSAQVGPTPTVTLPAPAPSTVLVSSGGGTAAPATAPAVAAPAGGFVEGIAAWLGGSTNLFNYNVPNALLAGVVVLGFAWLSSPSSGRRR